jgi:hypothetical protein
MRANNPVLLTEEQDAAQVALAGLRSREARGERLPQSAVSEAVRRLAEADMNAQYPTKRWEPTR